MQYAARLHAEKLKRLMHKQHKEEGGVLGVWPWPPLIDFFHGTNHAAIHMYDYRLPSLQIKNFNMRLAPEEVSTSLTGFEHNAVTPICSAAPEMPIVLSHR